MLSPLPSLSSTDSLLTSPSAFLTAAASHHRGGARAYPIILELGEMYIKVGIANEHSPRFILPTSAHLPAGIEELHACRLLHHNSHKHAGQQDDHDHHAHQQTNTLSASSTPFGASSHLQSAQKAKHLSTPAQQFAHYHTVLRSLFRSVYFSYIQCAPRDRRLILIENIHWSSVFKTAVLAVLKEMQVPAVLFVQNLVTPLYTLPSLKKTALVIDVGFAETRILPVFEGVPLFHALKTAPLGMRDVHHRFKELFLQTWRMDGPVAKLNKKQGDQSSTSHATDLHDTLATSDVLAEALVDDGLRLEDIFARSSFVLPWSQVILSNAFKQALGQTTTTTTTTTTTNADTSTATSSSSSSSFPTPLPLPFFLSATTSLTLPASIRYEPFEVLFLLNDRSETSLSSLLLSSLVPLSSEVRAAVASNILLCGGVTMYPGFTTRLYDETLHILLHGKGYHELKPLHDKLYFLSTTFHRNLLSFVGASVLGAMELNDNEFIPLADYDKYLKPRIKPKHAHTLSQTNSNTTHGADVEYLPPLPLPDWSLPHTLVKVTPPSINEQVPTATANANAAISAFASITSPAPSKTLATPLSKP